MKSRRLQRSEGNAPYYILTCAPLIIIAFAIGTVLGIGYPDAGALAVGISIIPMGCFYLWFVGAFMKGRWYLEVDDNGLNYRAFMLHSHYTWKDAVDVHSERTPGFVGKYDDNLVVEVRGKTLKFFLHSFGLTTKKPTVTFIEEVIDTWEKANPEAARKRAAPRKKPFDTEEEDVHDREY